MKLKSRLGGGYKSYLTIFRGIAILLSAFLLSYISSSIISPVDNTNAIDCVNGMISGTDDICDSDSTDVNVSIEGSWTVSISSAGTLGVNITPTSSGVVNTAVDNVNIYTNTPNGYQLYLNSTTGSTDIYNNSDTQQERNHFTATTGTKASPVSLTSNSWGYSLASSPTTFSKVEDSSSAVDALISTGSKTSGSGDNLDVTYGFKADTKLTPGTYTTSVTYTAVAEVPSYTISSVSPNELHINDQTAKQITIMTTTPSTELSLGDITAKIGTVDLTNCSETIVNGYRGATCTYNGNLPVGTYNVQLTSSWHSATYTLQKGFTIYKTVQDITTMQEMTADICNRMSNNQTTTLQDPRGSYNTTTPANYGIVKALDGNCWMRDDLTLYNKQISDADSSLPANTTITIPNTSTWDRNASLDTMRVHRATSSGYTNRVYYNWCSAVALTTTCDTTDIPQGSICPKGWILPNTNNASWGKLIGAYHASKASQLIDPSDPSYILNIKVAGYFQPWFVAESDQGSLYISASPSESSASYWLNPRLYDDYDVINTRYNGGKSVGGSIRCVFEL